MIEINLLPQDRRPVEKTPLGIFLGLVAGAAVVCASLFFFLKYQGQLSVKETELADRQTEHDRLKKEVEGPTEANSPPSVNELAAQITQARRREDSVITIAERRIPWSLKLQQFVALVPNDVFVNRIQLEPGGQASGGRLSLACTAKGGDPAVVTNFRQRLRDDESFYYHFNGFDSPQITRAPAPGGVDVQSVHNFDIRLTLQ